MWDFASPGSCAETIELQINDRIFGSVAMHIREQVPRRIVLRSGVFALVCLCGIAAVTLIAGTVAAAEPITADQIEKALAPIAPARRTTRGATAEGKTKETKELIDQIRRKRGPDLQDKELLREYTTGRPTFPVIIPFPFDSAEITPQAAGILDQFGLALKRETLANSTILISGHTDRKGTVQYNDELSSRRASAVKNYLVSQHGIDASRLEPIGYGFQHLKTPKRPYDETNRRVEFTNAY